MKRQLALLLGISVSISACHATTSSKEMGGGALTASGAPGSPVTPSADDQTLARYVSNSVAANDLQDTTLPTVPNGGGGQGNGGITIPAGFFSLPGEFLAPTTTSCVNTTNNGTAGNVDLLETFNCPDLTGTVETKGTKTSFDVTVKLTLTGALDSGTIDSDLTVTKDATTGDLTSARTFDDTFKVGADSFEAKGSSNDSVTPDAQTPGSGAISLNQTVTFSKNGASTGSYTVTSTGLMYANGCLDAGSIKIVGTTQTCTVTFAAAGTAVAGIPACAKPTVACVANCHPAYLAAASSGWQRAL
jgi:hypothetical protein